MRYISKNYLYYMRESDYRERLFSYIYIYLFFYSYYFKESFLKFLQKIIYFLKYLILKIHIKCNHLCTCYSFLFNVNRYPLLGIFSAVSSALESIKPKDDPAAHFESFAENIG